MSYNTKNYMRQGGNWWKIGGILEMLDGSSFIGPNPVGRKTWYVDSTVTASGNGKSWAGAFKTMTEASLVATAGDTIYVYTGTYNTNQLAESVSFAVAGLRIIGAGTNPDQAVWTGLAGDALTIAAAADCLVANIRFRPASGYSGIKMTGASRFTQILGNRFQGTTGSVNGISGDGSQADVSIKGNEFLYLNTASTGCAIKTVTGTAESAGWIIDGNKFHSNTNHIKATLRQSFITNNEFAGAGLLANNSLAAPDKCIDLTGSTGYNMVSKNTLGGAYTTALYVGATGDCWNGNWANATATTAPNGITILAPAA
jgi:hypothetical protein